VNRGAIVAALVLIAFGALIAPTVSEQYGAAAWRVLKMMQGTANCLSADTLCQWGDKLFYVSTVAEAQAALDDGCSEDVSGSVQSGCIVQFTRALADNGGVTLHLAGTGSMATGRSGVILRGVGGGMTAGTAGNPTSGTIIKSGGAVPMIDIGTCFACVIEDITLAGEDTATVGIDFLDPTGSAPTIRNVIRNVSMYEINGYGIRTSTTSQIDTILIENVSVRDSDGWFQQRNSQNIGIIFQNFDGSTLTSSGPGFDIQYGSFTLTDSFVSTKANENAFKFGGSASTVFIEGNQIEFPTSTSSLVFDFDEGASLQSNITINSNHFVYSEAGNTLFDVKRRGSMTVSNNWIEKTTTVGDKTLTSTFDLETTGGNNQFYLQLSNNSTKEMTTGDVNRPERWIPTIGSGVTLLTPTLYHATDLPLPCLDGESGIDGDEAAGSRHQVCLSGAWTAP
jgi:hypothetical protein